MGAYEEHYEEGRSRAVVLSDLIEQIFLVNQVIKRHEAAGTVGLVLAQYVERKAELVGAVNGILVGVGFVLVEVDTQST